MSREIDERVVQMKFENGQFEKRVQTSINSIKQLNQSMHFDEAIKGMDNLDRSAKNLDLSKLDKAADLVINRFTLLGRIGYEALDRIAKKAVDTGEKMVKSLSTDQISSGWDKFANKTGAVQTIMAATAKQFTDTGVQMAYVNDQLDKLNWFTDETSYNFVDMVSNIGKFTSNNISLDASVTAMQGIANWAAISGANAGEASRAMYNLSQAISSGSLRLQDWMSIENANMGTAAFKEMAIQAALTAGTLVQVGDKIMTVDRKMEVSVESFRETLSKKWLDSNVLMNTLNEYGAATNRLNEIYEEYKILTSDIVSGIADFTNGTKTAEEVSEDWGLSLEETSAILEEFQTDTMQFGLKAFQAAQEAKTFADAIDAVKDAVSTGWMKSFELIFGDYMQAKEFWTNIANELYSIFAESSEARNEVLKEWNELGGRNYFIGSIYNILEAIRRVLLAIKNGWASVFGTVNAEKLRNLTKRFGEFTEKLVMNEEQFKKLARVVRGVASILDIFKTILFGGVSNAFRLANSLLGKFNLDILGLLANIGDVIYAFNRWFHQSTLLTDVLEGAIQAVAWLSSGTRDLIVYTSKLEIVQSIFGGIIMILSAFAIDARNYILLVKNTIADFVNYLRITNFKISSFDDVVAFFKLFYEKVLKEIFDLSKVFPNLSAAIDIAFDAIRTAINSVTGPLAVIRDIIAKVIDVIKDFVSNITVVDVALLLLGAGIFLTLSKIGKAVSLVASAVSGFTDVLSGIQKSIKGFLRAKGMESYAKSILILVAAIAVLTMLDKERLWSAAAVIAALAAGVTAFSIAMDKFGGKKGGLVTAKAFALLGVAILALAGALAFVDTGGDLVARMGVLATLISAALGVAYLMSKMGDGPQKGSAAILSFATAVFMLTASVKLLSMLDAGDLLKGLLAVAGLLGSMAIVMKSLGGASTNVLNVGNGTVKVVNKAAGSILGMALGLNLIILAIKGLGNLDIGTAIKGIIQLGIILAEIGVFYRIAGNISGGKGASSTVLAMAVSINLIIPAIKSLSKIGASEMSSAAWNIAQIGAIFIAAIVATRAAGQHAAKASVTLIAFAAAMAIMPVIVRLIGAMDKKTLTQGTIVISILGGLMIALIAVSKNSKKATKAIYALTGLITVVGVVIYALGSLEWKSALSASVGVSVVLLSLAETMKIVSKVKLKKNLPGILSLMVIVLGAVALILHTMVEFSGDIKKAIGISTALAILIPSLAASMKMLSGFKSISAKAQKQLLVMIGIVGIIGLIITGLTKFGGNDISTAVTVATSIAILLPIITGCFAILSKTKLKMRKDAIIQFGILAAVIVGIGEAISLIAKRVDSETMNKGKPIIASIYAVTPLLIATFAILSKAKLKLRKGTAKDFAVLATIAIAIGGAIAALALIPGTDITRVISIVGSIGVLMPILSKTFNMLRSSKGKIDTKLLRQFALFGTIAVALGGVIAAISSISKATVSRTISVAGSIALLIPVLTSTFNSMRKSKAKIDTKLIGQFALFGVVAVAIGAAIAAIATIGQPSIEHAMAVVVSIGILIPILTATFGLLKASGNGVSMSTVASFAAFSATAAGLGALIALVGNVKGVDKALIVSTSLGMLIPVLAGVVTSVSYIGVGPQTVAAALFLGVAIDALFAVVVAAVAGFGYLADNIDWIGKGIEAAVKYFPMIGEAIGGLLGGFLSGSIKQLLTILPVLGENLSLFMYNAEPFFKGLESINGDMLDGALRMLAIVGILAGTTFLDLIAGLLDKVGDFLEFFGLMDSMGDRFYEFGQAIAGFAYGMGDIDVDQVRAAAEAVEILSALEKNIPPMGGMLDTFIGRSDIGEFGARLVEFGEHLVEFVSIVGDTPLGGATAAAAAASALAEVENKLPPSNGKLQEWLGSKDIGDFGRRLVRFGKKLVEFAEDVEGITAASVQGAANAGEILINLEKSIDPHGGFVQFITGHSDIDDFGIRIVKFGKSLASFADEVEDITQESVEGAAQAGKLMALLEVMIPKHGGAAQMWSGSKNLDDFGDRMLTYGIYLRAFVEIVRDIKKSDVEGATAAGQILNALETSLPSNIVTIALWNEIPDLSHFIGIVQDLGKGVRKFADEISGIKPDTIEEGVKAFQFLLVVLDFTQQIGGSNLFGKNSALDKIGNDVLTLGRILNLFGSIAASVDYNSIQNALDALREIYSFGDTIGESTDWKPGITKAVNSISADLVTNVQAQKIPITQSGENIARWNAEGVVKGIKDTTPIVTSAATNFALSIDRTIRNTLGIASPSVVMEENGMWIVKGIAEGIDTETSAEDAATKKANNIVAAFQTVFDSADIKLKAFDLQQKLWEVTEGKHASDAEKKQHEINTMMGDLDFMAEKVATQAALMKSIAAEFGEASAEYQKANNDYLQYQIDMYTKANEIEELTKTSGGKDLKERIRDSAAWAKENAEAYRIMGLSEEQLLADARKAAGVKLNAYNPDEWGGMYAAYEDAIKSGNLNLIETVEQQGMGSNVADIIAKAFVEKQVENEPYIIEQVQKSVGSSVSSGVSGGLNDFADQFEQTTSPSIFDKVMDTVEKTFGEGYAESEGFLSKAMANLGVDVEKWGLKVGTDGGVSYADGTNSEEARSAIISANNDLADAGISAMKKKLGISGNKSATYETLGKSVNEGYIAGILGGDGRSSAVSNAVSLVTDTFNAMKTAADVNSPSKKAMVIGNFVSEGFAIGLQNGSDNARTSAEDLANNAMAGLDYAKTLIDATLANDENFAPTIRPVIDFDELQHQTDKIPKMFGRTGLNLSAANMRANRIATPAQSSSQNGSGASNSQTTYNFTQNNYSPKALSKSEIYRQTRNQFSQLKGATER